MQGTSQGSQDSLDKRSSLPRMKSYDAVVFDVLRVSPEDFAVRALTILDTSILGTWKTASWLQGRPNLRMPHSLEKHSISVHLVLFVDRY